MQHQQLITDLGSLLARFQQNILEVLPNLVGALGIFLVGLALAFFVRWATRRLVKGLDRLVPGAKLQQSLRRVKMQQPAAELISRLLFWIIILFFATAATETLGLPIVTTWLNGIALYLPRILSASLIVWPAWSAGC